MTALKTSKLFGTAALASFLLALPALAQDAAAPAVDAAAAATEVVAEVAAATVDKGDTTWMLVSTILVIAMTIPGLALFYGGLVRAKNMLSVLMQVMSGFSLMAILWVIYGYSLAFNGPTEGGLSAFIGDFSKLFLAGVTPDSTAATFTAGVEIPELTFIIFQLTFAAITPALIVGAIAERMKFGAVMAFLAIWFTFSYLPIAHMVWFGGGYLFGLGAYDFAGGTVVHINAGVAGLVAAMMLGKRREFLKEPIPPHNLTFTFIGACLLWVGWFGFNAGSTVHSGLDTARALTMTQISAATGALVWMLIEAVKFRKTTSLGFVSGILAGLVAITPAAGVVQPAGAMILGACSAGACYFALSLKGRFGYDDSLDCFGVHGVGSGMGVLLLSFLIRPSWMTEAAAAAGGSWTALDQLGVQLTGMGTTIALAAVGTLAICIVVQKTVGFRLSAAEEMAGVDHSLHGEHGYGMLNLNS